MSSYGDTDFPRVTTESIDEYNGYRMGTATYRAVVVGRFIRINGRMKWER